MLIIQSQNLHNFAGTIINIACGSLLIGGSVKIKNTTDSAVLFLKWWPRQDSNLRPFDS